jgi:hypothetical protein
MTRNCFSVTEELVIFYPARHVGKSIFLSGLLFEEIIKGVCACDTIL